MAGTNGNGSKKSGLNLKDVTPPEVGSSVNQPDSQSAAPATDKPSEAGVAADSSALASESGTMFESKKRDWGSRLLLVGAALAALVLIGILVWPVVSGLISERTTAVFNPDQVLLTAEQRQIAGLRWEVAALKEQQKIDSAAIQKLAGEVSGLKTAMEGLTTALKQQSKAAKPAVINLAAKPLFAKKVAAAHLPAKASTHRRASAHATYQRGVQWHQKLHHGAKSVKLFSVTSAMNTALLVCQTAYPGAKPGECRHLLPAMLGAIGAQLAGTDIHIGQQAFPPLKTLRGLAGIHRQGAP